MLSTNIEMNIKEINTLIILNLLKLLKRRKLIDNYNELYNTLKQEILTKTIINIPIKNNQKISVYILNSKLNSIVQNSPIDDYLSNNTNIHKFVIIKTASKKVVKQIINKYINCEFFHEHEFLEDIPDKNFIPKHEILNDEDKQYLLEKINFKDLSHIYKTDMMARYYNAQIDDIIKITRANITCGKSVFYRRVIPGTVDNLFL